MDVVIEKVELKRTVSVFSGCAYIMGTIIGSGIFVSPKGVAMEAGSVGTALLVWGLCGVLVLLGAMCYAELGTIIPRTGGPYEYIREAFGDFPAFIYCWAIVMIVLPTGNAVIALTFATYSIKPFFPDCESPEYAVILLAAVALATLIFVNGFSSLVSARIQTFFTLVKVFALVLIITCGIYALSQGRTENFDPAFKGSAASAGGISMAFYSGMFSYAGWDTLNFLTEELKNPYRFVEMHYLLDANLPLCIGISIPLVTIVYVMSNVAYFTVLTPAAMIESEAVAVSFAAELYPLLASLMPVFVACSCFGSLNGCISCAGRVFYAGSRQGHMPEFLSLIHSKKYTPITSVMALGVVSSVFLLVGDVFTLINYCAFVEVLSFATCVSALLYLRYKYPDKPRPIRVPLICPIIFFIVNVFLIILGLIYEPVETGFGLLMVLSGIPFYVIGVAWTDKPVAFKRRMRKITELIQKSTLSLPQDE